jgi:CheY-like chemotaxis protein
MEHKTESDHPLQGMRVLVADDEFLIVVCIEETLRDAGAEVISAATLAAALTSATHDPLSAALLDVRLGRQTTETVADVLAERGVPFVFYSGQALPDRIRKKHPDAKVLGKPSRQGAFVETIAEIGRH